MELKNMKQEEIERVEVYYEQIQKLAHSLQVLTIDNFLITMFRASLQTYLRIATSKDEVVTLQQHKEVGMLCEEGMITTKARSALSIPHNTKQIALVKT
jgi:hypothetical protein